VKFSELVRLLEQNSFELIREKVPSDIMPSKGWIK